MTTTTLVIIGYVLGTILIGVPMGKKSIAIYKTTQEISIYSEKIRGFWAFLLFPWSVFQGKELAGCIDDSPGIEMILLDGHSSSYWAEKKNYGAYLAFTAMFWPIRVYFNSVVIITYIGLYTAAGILMFVLIFLPKFIGTFLCTTKETN